MALTIKSFKELWTKELMPNFKKDLLNELKREISKEIQYVADRFECQIREVSNQLQSLESSQSFLSDKYESVMEITQVTKKELKAVQNQSKETQERIKGIEGEVFNNMASLDDMQQYLRRDCLEITGIPVVPLDDPSNLVAEVCSVLNVNLEANDISIAHRLPATRNIKDRIIVKFVKRSKRDEIHKRRSMLMVKPHLIYQL